MIVSTALPGEPLPILILAAYGWRALSHKIKVARLEFLCRCHSQRQRPLTGCPADCVFRCRLWPTPRLCFAPLTRQPFYLGIKAVVAQGLVLVQCQAQVVDGFLVQLRPEQRSIGALALFVFVTQRQVNRVRCQVGVGLPERYFRC